MGAIAGILVNFAVMIGGQFAARFGYNVALVAAVVTVYLTIFAALVAAISALTLLIPVSPFPPYVLQFFPSRAAIATAATAYWGTAATLMAYGYWKQLIGVAAAIAKS